MTAERASPRRPFKPYTILRIRVPIIKGVTTSQWRDHVHKALMQRRTDVITYEDTDIRVTVSRKRNIVSWLVTSDEQLYIKPFLTRDAADTWADVVRHHGHSATVVPLIVGQAEVAA